MALTQDSAQEAAASIVLRLLGGRLIYPPVLIVERYYSPRQRVNLTGRPVIDVDSVTDPAGRPVPFDVIVNRSALLLSPQAPTLRSAWCFSGPAYVEVTYLCGVYELPVAVQEAIDVLAGELLLASSGQPCSLPQRITSVTRQGVSWTVLDPQDFLDQGRTGLYQVDLVLSTYNAAGAKARARVFSPEYQPPLRISETVQ